MTPFRLDDDEPDPDEEEEDDFEEDEDKGDDEDDEDEEEEDGEEEETWQVSLLTSPIELPRLAGISSSAKLELTWLDRVAHVFYP